MQHYPMPAGRFLWLLASASVSTGVCMLWGMGYCFIAAGGLILFDLYMPGGKG